MDLASILQWWSFVFLGVIVYSIGQGVKMMFPKIVNTSWYHHTLPGHAPILATLIAAIPIFPMPDQIGSGLGARLLFGAVAGICASWSYKALMRLLGKDTKSVAQQDASTQNNTEGT